MGMTVHMQAFTVLPPGESVPETQLVRYWVGPRTGLDNVPQPKHERSFMFI